MWKLQINTCALLPNLTSDPSFSQMRKREECAAVYGLDDA